MLPSAAPTDCPYAEGDVVYCPKEGHARYKQVVRIQNGTARLYSDRQSWELDGSPPPTDKSDEVCDKLDNCAEGDPMPGPGAHTLVKRR